MLPRHPHASTVRQGRPSAIVLLVAMLILPLLAGAVLPAPRTALAATATTTTALNLRSGPGTSYGVLTVIPAGAVVTVDGDPRNGFSPVLYAGTSGWAASSFLALGGDGGGGGATSGPATTTTSLNLRSGAGTGYGVITVMPAGATVTLTGQQANGFVSLTYQGTAGWAASQYLTSGAPSSGDAGGDTGATPAPSAGTAVTTTSLNLRSGAGTNYGVIAVMPAGATVTLTGIDQNGYYYVVYNGMMGWAHTQYLSLGTTGGSGTGWGEAGSTEEIIQIIYAAADRYGQPREDMLRVARCESGLNPNAVNPSGSYGLFQFIPSTWATTPYAQYDIYDAWASANAAGWMWSVGRRGEWVCQ